MWEEKVRHSQELRNFFNWKHTLLDSDRHTARIRFLSTVFLLQTLEKENKWGINLTVARTLHQVLGSGEAFAKRIMRETSRQTLHKLDKHDVETYSVKTQPWNECPHYLLCYSQQVMTEVYVNSRAWPSLDGSLHNLKLIFSSDLSLLAFKLIFLFCEREDPPDSSFVALLWLNARWKTWHHLLVSNGNT